MFELFFKKNIHSIERINKQKSDIVIHFIDGTSTNIQIKNFHNNRENRGHSIDRRSVSKYNTIFRPILNLVSNQLPLICKTIPNTIDIYKQIQELLLGDFKKYMPDYILVTNTNIKDGQQHIYEIKICTMTAFMDCLKKLILPNTECKRTCVHLLKYGSLYLQRKGGTNSDKNANHIQAKLCFIPELYENFVSIYDKHKHYKQIQTKITNWMNKPV